MQILRWGNRNRKGVYGMWSGRNLDWEISHLILGWDGTLSSEEHSVKVSSRVYIHIATNVLVVFMTNIL